MNILVLDVGTSSMRGTILDDSAQTLWRQQISYCPTCFENSWVEQDPEDWLSALQEICASAASFGAVGALALTAQRSSLIPLGADGRPLRKAIMWQDTRNRPLCDALKDQDDRVHSLSGAGINTVFSGPKMAWLRREEPDIYEKAQKLLVIPDYLIFKMTGELVTDHSYGSRSLLMDIRSRQWSPELLEIFGLENKLCRLIAPSGIAGFIRPEFSALTGIPAGTPVISCGGDQQCAALGQGITEAGKAAVNLGTGAYLLAAADTVAQHLPRGLVCSASALPEQYILEAAVVTCGSAIDWFLPHRDPHMLRRALRESPAGARGVLSLPYFQGRAAPDWNSAARGAFFNLSLQTGPLDMLRALLEGITIEIGRSLKQIEQLQPIDTLYLSGGLSRTPEMCQLVADITAKNVLYAEDCEATTRGAWMSAAHRLGLVSDWSDAWARIQPADYHIYRPNMDNSALYAQRAAQMEDLYHSIYKTP